MALPQVGVEALFLIEKFKRNAAKYDKILGQTEKSQKKLGESTAKTSQDMAKSFDELIKKSGELKKAMAEMSSKRQANLVEGLRKSFDDLGKGVSIDVGKFDALSASGKAIGTAFKGAKGAVSGVGSAVGAMAGVVGAALAGIGVAVGVAVAGIGLLISTVKKSIAAFQESAMALRNFQLQVGGSTEQVSGLVQSAKLAGMEMGQLASGVGMFEKKMIDFELRAAVGSEESHEFERAMETLGVAIKDGSGNLRVLDDIMLDMADRFKELGPGVTTTGIAMNLFGRSGRQMLPFLMQGADGLQRFNEIAERTGSIMTSKDVKAADDFRIATTELEMSLEGLKNTIARHVLPLLERLAKFISHIVQNLNSAATAARGLASALIAGAMVLARTRDAALAAQAAMDVYAASVDIVTGKLTEQEQAEEDALIARQRAMQDIARGEMARAEILDKIAELEEQDQERRLDAERQFNRQWEDIITERERELEDSAIKEQRKREDLWLAFQRKLEDIQADFDRRRRDAEADNARKLENFYIAAANAREKLLNRHLERMHAIQEKFDLAAGESARRNDAVGLLRAMRQRDVEVRLEEEKYQNRRDELERDLALKLKKLLESFAEQERKDQQRLDDAIARARLAYARQLEDLEIALEREEEDRVRAWQRQEDDYNLAMERMDDDRQRWYDKEREELDTQLEAIDALLDDAYDRRGANYTAYLENEYTTTEDHLENMGALMRDFTRVDRPPTFTPTSPSAVFPQVFGRAEGGVDVVNKPTLFLAGEGGGPEIHAWAPMSSGVHHSFDRLGMDVSGVSSATEAQIAPIVIAMLERMTRQIT